MDVYDIATSIGNDCQTLLVEYGNDALKDMMPKIVYALEVLDDVRRKQTDETEELHTLRATISHLKKEKDEQLEERDNYESMMQQMEKSWHCETQQLIEKLNKLEVENKKLHADLLKGGQDVSPTEATPAKSKSTVGSFVKAIAEGKRPPPVKISTERTPGSLQSSSSSSTSCLLNETDQRLHSNTQENRTADINLISRLKDCSVENSSLIRKLRREEIQLAAHIEAAQHESCRLAKLRGNLIATYCGQGGVAIETVRDKKRSLEEKLSSLEQELAVMQCDSGLQYGDNEAAEKEAADRLRKLYEQRNHLRCMVVQTCEELAILEDAKRQKDEADEELLYGPIPEEPADKLHGDPAAAAAAGGEGLRIELLEKFLQRLRASTSN